MVASPNSFTTVIPSKMFECMGMGLPILHGVAGESADIVRREDIRQKIFAQGWQVVGTSSEGLRRRIESDTAVMADVIQRNNIRP